MLFNQTAKPYYTVIGAYMYDPELLDGAINIIINIDDTVKPDKETVATAILYNNRDLILYETDLDRLKILIRLWAKKESENFRRIWLALTQDYNPLHNYDRFEEIKDISTGTDNLTDTYGGTYTDVSGGTDNTDFIHGKQTSHTGTDNLSKSENTTENHTGTEGTSHKNTAFNSGISETARDDVTRNLSDTKTMTGADNRTLDTRETNSGTDKENTTTTNRLDHTTSGSDTHNRATGGTNTHTGHMYGNIGVTTSQRMAEDECLLRMKYNFYDLVAESFRKEFCLLVY